MSHATTPVLRGLAEVLDRLGDALVRDLKRARHGEAVGVHRARVASRRLREALALIGGRTTDTDPLRRELRRLRDGLGPVREIDVAREVLEGEARRRAWVDAAVGRVRRALERARQDYWNELADRLERLDEGRLGHRLTALATTLDRAPRRADSTARLAARLVRRARQFSDALQSVGPLYVPAPLHRARIAGKKLRYSLELARDLHHVPVGRDILALRTLQDTLGRLHDLQVLQTYIATAEVEASGDRGARHTLAAMGAILEGECRTLHADFLRALPRLEALTGRVTLLAASLRRPRARRMLPSTDLSSRSGAARGA